MQVRAADSERSFCPLDLLIGLGAPLEFEIHIAPDVRIVIHAKPMRMRTVLALWGLQRFSDARTNLRGCVLTPRVDASAVILNALHDCIVKLYINDVEVTDFAQLNPVVVAALFDFCLQINGIVGAGAQRLQEALDGITAQVKADLERDREEYGAPEPQDIVGASPYLHIAQIAYSALSTGAKLTADYWLDEPYLLVLAAMAVAKGERDYFRERNAEMAQRAQSSQLQVLGTELQSLLNKTQVAPPLASGVQPSAPPTLPKPPIVRIRKGDDIVRQMERLAEQIAGIKLSGKK